MPAGNDYYGFYRVYCALDEAQPCEDLVEKLTSYSEQEFVRQSLRANLPRVTLSRSLQNWGELGIEHSPSALSDEVRMQRQRLTDVYEQQKTNQQFLTRLLSSPRAERILPEKYGALNRAAERVKKNMESLQSNAGIIQCFGRSLDICVNHSKVIDRDLKVVDQALLDEFANAYVFSGSEYETFALPLGSGRYEFVNPKEQDSDPVSIALISEHDGLIRIQCESTECPYEGYMASGEADSWVLEKLLIRCESVLLTDFVS